METFFTNKIPQIFIKLDGVIFEYQTPEQILISEPKLVIGAKEKLLEWSNYGHYIVILASRPKSMKDLTIKQLEEFDIPYDDLIMNLSNNAIYLINYDKQDFNFTTYYDTAIGITINKNQNINKIRIR